MQLYFRRKNTIQKWLGVALLFSTGALLSAAERSDEREILRKVLLNELSGAMIRSEAPDFLLHVVIGNGAVFDRAGKEGLSLIAARCVLRRIRQEIAISVQELPQTPEPESDIWVTHDAVRFTVRGNPTLLFAVGQAFARVLSSDGFDDRLVSDIRDDLGKELQAKEAAPPWMAESAFRDMLYAPFPYGRSPSGTVASVKTITKNDVIRHFRRCFIPNRTFVRLAARLDETEFRRFLIQSFGAWTKGDPLPPQFAPPRNEVGPETRFVKAPGATESFAVLGVECFKRKNEDFPAAWILSRLAMQRLAAIERRRPGYTIVGVLEGLLLRGHFCVRVQGPVPFDLTVIEEIMRSLAALADQPFTLQDLAVFQKEWNTAVAERQASPADALDQMTEMEWFRLGSSVFQAYLRPMEALIPEDIPYLARTLFAPARFKVAVAGPELPTGSEIPSALKPAAPLATPAEGRQTAPDKP